MPKNASDSFALTQQLLLTKHGPEMVLLGRLRTVERLKRGLRLARQSYAMEGYFHWVPAGPEMGPQGRFLPNERRPEAKSGKAEVEDDETNPDHFAIWLNRGGREPGKQSSMNCWEAVFFSAYKAELVSVQWLRLIHAKATQAARTHLAPFGADGFGGSPILGQALAPAVQPTQDGMMSEARESYYGTLMSALGLSSALPIIPEIGLLPDPGDIIFVSDEHHVTICLEVLTAPSLQDIVVMSLWKHPSDGFQKLSIKECGGLTKYLKFAPCPF
jgi:hypothetical protein